MITGEIKSHIDQVWNVFWTGGIANPLEVIEQITYLLFLRRLDDLHTLEENKSARLKKPMERRVFPEDNDPKGRPFRTRPDRLLPEFRFQFTHTDAYHSWVAVRQRVVAQPNINARQYGQELRLPYPPIQLQTQFAFRLQIVDRVRESQRTALVEGDSLFASLQNRAFRGEL